MGNEPVLFVSKQQTLAKIIVGQWVYGCVCLSEISTLPWNTTFAFNNFVWFLSNCRLQINLLPFFDVFIFCLLEAC